MSIKSTNRISRSDAEAWLREFTDNVQRVSNEKLGDVLDRITDSPFDNFIVEDDARHGADSSQPVPDWIQEARVTLGYPPLPLDGSWGVVGEGR